MPRISSAGGLTGASGSVIGSSTAKPAGQEANSRRAGRHDAGPLVRVACTEPLGYFGGAPHAGAGGQVCRVPAFIAASAASSLPWRSAGQALALSCPGEAPMPSLVASKCELPPFAVPFVIAMMVDEVATERCFSALVTMHLAAFG